MKNKKSITLFTYAIKWSFEGEFNIEHSVNARESCDSFLVIPINEQQIEIEDAALDENKLTLAHVEYLRGLKSKVKAKAQVDLNSLDEQINTLLCIEDKGAAL